MSTDGIMASRVASSASIASSLKSVMNPFSPTIVPGGGGTASSSTSKYCFRTIVDAPAPGRASSGAIAASAAAWSSPA